MNLVAKLSAVVSAVIALVLTVILWRSYQSERHRFEEDQDRRIETALRRLTRHCRPEQEDAEELCLEGMRYFIEFAAPEAFVRAMLVDPRLRILAHSDFLAGESSARGSISSELGVQLAANSLAPLRQATDGGARSLFSVPIMAGPRRLGTLVAVFDRATLREASAWVLGDARRRMFQAACAAVAVGTLLSIQLINYFLLPLRPLERATERASAGDFASRVPAGQAGELGRLADGFNRLMSRLQELDDLKESFLAKVTHDLRSPLSCMIGYAGLLLEASTGTLNAWQRETVQIILRNGHALAELINNMLDVTQLEAGRMAFRPTPLELPAEVDSVLALLRFQAEEYQLTLTANILPGLSTVYADPQAFRRVLTNLISNAMKFTPAGGLVTVKAHRGKPNEVILAVSDTGIGIPQERLPGIFAKFSQVPETKNKVRPARGTGLGLLICKEIVETHGGRIWVESELNQGTTFVFTLPETEARHPRSEPTTPEAAATAPEPPGEPRHERGAAHPKRPRPVPPRGGGAGVERLERAPDGKRGRGLGVRPRRPTLADRDRAAVA